MASATNAGCYSNLGMVQEGSFITSINLQGCDSVGGNENIFVLATHTGPDTSSWNEDSTHRSAGVFFQPRDTC